MGQNCLEIHKLELHTPKLDTPRDVIGHTDDVMSGTASSTFSGPEGNQGLACCNFQLIPRSVCIFLVATANKS